MSDAKKRVWASLYYDDKRADYDVAMKELSSQIGEIEAEDFAHECDHMEDEYSQAVACECDYCPAELTYVDLKMSGCPNEGCLSHMDRDSFNKMEHGTYG